MTHWLQLESYRTQVNYLFQASVQIADSRVNCGVFLAIKLIQHIKQQCCIVVTLIVCRCRSGVPALTNKPTNFINNIFKNRRRNCVWFGLPRFADRDRIADRYIYFQLTVFRDAKTHTLRATARLFKCGLALYNKLRSCNHGTSPRAAISVAKSANSLINAGSLSRGSSF